MLESSIACGTRLGGLPHLYVHLPSSSSTISCRAQVRGKHMFISGYTRGIGGNQSGRCPVRLMMAADIFHACIMCGPFVADDDIPFPQHVAVSPQSTATNATSILHHGMRIFNAQGHRCDSTGMRMQISRNCETWLAIGQLRLSVQLISTVGQ